MNSPKDNANIEQLVEKFDLLLESQSSSLDSINVDALSDQELFELNRRISCLNLLEAARQNDDESTGRPSLTKCYSPTEKKSLDSSSFSDDTSGSGTVKTIGGYHVVRTIGQGGYGTVYLGYDEQLERQVAIKVPHSHLLKLVDQSARFEREAKAAALLSHPNLIPLLHSCTSGDEVYLVYGYARGPDMAKWFADHQKPLAPDTAATMVATLAEAVQHAHVRGVIHRDLKPSNILFLEKTDGKSENELAANLCISDFGLARIENKDQSLTMTGDVLGTPAYMSPEQATGDSSTSDERSDIYSLGTILYEMLVGRPPFRQSNPIKTLRAVESDPVPWPGASYSLPSDLKAICMRCLEKRPSDRYHNAQQLADDLNRFLRGEPVSVREPTMVERFSKWFKRNPNLGSLSFALAASLLIGMVGVSYFAFWSNRNAQSAKKNESKWQEEATRANQNERQIQSEKNRVDKLLRKARYQNYGLQLSEAFRHSLAGYTHPAMEILQTSPLEFRGFEHDLVYSHNQTPHSKFELDGPISRCEYSNNGKSVYVVVESQVLCFDIASRQQIDAFDIKLPCYQFAVSPNDQQFAVGDQKGIVKILARSGEVVAEYQALDQIRVSRIEFSSVPNTVLLCLRYPTKSLVVEWDFAKDDSKTIFESSQQILNIQLDQPGRSLAIAERSRLLVFDYPDLEKRFECVLDFPQNIRFDGENHRVLVTHSDRSYAVIDDQSGEILASRPAHSGTAFVGPTIKPGRILTFSDRGDLRIWDFKESVMTLEMNLGGPFHGAFFDKTTQTLVAVGDEKIRFFDLSQRYAHAVLPISGGTEALKSIGAEDLWVTSVANVKKNGSRIARCSWTSGVEGLTLNLPVGCYLDFNQNIPLLTMTNSDSISLLRIEDQVEIERRLKSIQWNKNPVPWPFWKTKYDSNRDRVYVCGQSGLLYFGRRKSRWNQLQPLQLKVEKERPSPTNGCTEVAISADGNVVAAGYFDGHVAIFDAESGEQRQLMRFGVGTKSVVSKLDFSRDMKSMLVTIANQGTTVLDIDNQYTTRFGFGRGGSAACFSADGQTIAVAAGKDESYVIELFDVRTGTTLGKLFGHSRRINDLCFSSNGKWLFSGSANIINSCRVWDLNMLVAE